MFGDWLFSYSSLAKTDESRPRDARHSAGGLVRRHQRPFCNSRISNGESPANPRVSVQGKDLHREEECVGNNFSGEKAFEHLRVLAEEIGPRHGGSKNEKRAPHYIHDHFEGLGLAARLQSYPIYSFEGAQATLSSPTGVSIPCIPVPITGVTPSEGITRPVVFLEGNDAVHLDDRVKDKIVVMFDSFKGDLQKAFHSYDPAGLVSIQTRANMAHVRAPSHSRTIRKTGPLPAVLLTLDDGLALLHNMPDELSMTVSTESEMVTNGYNVVADLQGSDSYDDIVLVCAHYDSVWAGPGAFDNCGGAAAIMELARVYAEHGSRRNLRFIAFGGEEMGVWGSKSYVKELKDEELKQKENREFELDGLRSELNKHRFLINLDMMGPLYGRSTAITLGDNDIAASVRLLANELRYAIRVRENAVYSSDNMTFNYVGIPSLSFNRCPFERVGGHTVEDTIESCSAEGLAHIGEFVESWINRYVQKMHSFPFSRTLSAAAKDAVKDWYKEKNPLDYTVFSPEKQYSREALTDKE